MTLRRTVQLDMQTGNISEVGLDENGRDQTGLQDLLTTLNI